MRVSRTNRKLLNNSLLPCKPGVYKIINKKDKKFYIGSAVNIKARKSVHLTKLRKNKHPNSYLQNAYNLHGEENFEFIALEICKKESLISREQELLDLFFDNQTKCYNINPKANSWLGRQHSEASKKKMSESHQGKKLTKKTKKKMSIAQSGKKLSKETKEAIGKHARKRQSKVENCPQWKRRGEDSAHKRQTEVVTPNGQKLTFATIKEAAEFVGINPSSVSRALKTNRTLIKGYKFLVAKRQHKKSGPKQLKHGNTNPNSKMVIVETPTGNRHSFTTINEAASFIGSPPSSVSRAIHGKGTLRGYKLQLVTT